MHYNVTPPMSEGKERGIDRPIIDHIDHSARGKDQRKLFRKTLSIEREMGAENTICQASHAAHII